MFQKTVVSKAYERVAANAHYFTSKKTETRNMEFVFQAGKGRASAKFRRNGQVFAFARRLLALGPVVSQDRKFACANSGIQNVQGQ